MDTYRGNFVDNPDLESGRDYEAESYAKGSYDGIDDEAGSEMPPAAVSQDERRMQVRAYNHWASLLGDRNLPAIDGLDITTLPDFAPFSVLLDFTGGADNPTVLYLGVKLAEECGTAGAIRTLADVPKRSLLSRITDHYMQILAHQAPIGFEAEFVNQRERTILYRGILLPFSNAGETIDFIYGVINWKELADAQTSDELLLEIDQALGASPVPESAPVGPREPLTEWADGPADFASVLDLVSPLETGQDGIAWPAPAFGTINASLSLDDAAATQDMPLADWLASARELAQAARGSEDRTRQALYAAIGRAYDFSLAAAAAPEEFDRLVRESGLTIQVRAPLTPLVKLVFGADYDKTRLTEY
ncbi:MAG: hypothetical protein JF593_14685, partial [Novosphingobium sp.]|nr:hypothetical protein [Novosphingobium sp.]